MHPIDQGLCSMPPTGNATSMPSHFCPVDYIQMASLTQQTEFEQTAGYSEGQGSQESDMTKPLNNIQLSPPCLRIY